MGESVSEHKRRMITNLLMSLLFLSINRDILSSHSRLLILLVVLVHLIGQSFPPRRHSVLKGVAVHCTVGGEEDVWRQIIDTSTRQQKDSTGG